MDPEPESLPVPPHSQEVEEAAIGACLIHPAMFAVMAGELKAADFYIDVNRWIWEAMTRLAARHDPIDVITVADELGSRLVDVGGNSHLSKLANLLGSSLNGEAYGRSVKHRSVRRAFLRAAQTIAAQAYRDEVDVFDLISLASREVRAASQGIADGRSRPASELGPELYARAQARAANKEDLPGISIGIPELEHMLAGGLRPGQLIVVGAPPGGGKTSLLTQFAAHAARASHVRFHTLEMSPEEIAVRMLAQMSGLNAQEIEAGFIPDDKWGLLATAVDDLSRLNLDVDDSAPLDVPRLHAIAAQAQADQGLDLLVVDYAGLMRAPGDDEYEQYRVLSRDLKELAHGLGVPLLAAHQLNRQAHQQGAPQYWNLRGSGTWEQDADVVLLIYPVGSPTPEGVPYRLKVAKQRNGPIGEVDLVFHPESTRFEQA